jgi:hypothetical protein
VPDDESVGELADELGDVAIGASPGPLLDITILTATVNATTQALARRGARYLFGRRSCATREKPR